MNWLIFPHVGMKKLRGESNFILFEDMARVFSGHGDFVYFVVPSWIAEEDMWLKDESNVKYVKIDFTGMYYHDMAVGGDIILNEFCRSYSASMIDIVITSMPITAFLMAFGIGQNSRSDAPIIYFEPGVENKIAKIKTAQGKDSALSAMIAMGWSVAKSIFLTNYEKELATAFIRKYMSPSIVRKFLDDSVVIPVGVPCDILDDFKKQEKDEVFTIFFGARINEVKNSKKILELYDKFFRAGRNVKIVVCTPTNDKKSGEILGKDMLAEGKQIEFFYEQDRDEYLKMAAKAHCFVSMSKREGFPVGFYEQLYLGLVGVFIDKPWVNAQFPKEYPFIYKNDKEAYYMLSKVYDDYEGCLKQIEPYTKDIKEKFDKMKIYSQVRDMAGECTKEMDGKHQYGISTALKELIDICLKKLGKVFRIDEMLDLMEDHGNAFNKNRRKRAILYKFPSNYDIYRYLTTDLGLKYRIIFGKEDDIEFIKEN